MRHHPGEISLALIALLTVALVRPGPAQAQQPSKDLLTYKATETGVTEVFVIPMDPPIGSFHWTGAGESNLLGSYTLMGTGLLTLGVDGAVLAVTDGRVLWSAANGDALFLSNNAISRPSSKPGFGAAEGTWTVTGGRGRFLGASGSGVWRGEIEVATGKYTGTFEGSLLVAKKVQ